MAHVEKYTRQACGHMLAHYNRTAQHIGNDKVDCEKTHLNYNLATHQQMEQEVFVKKRCSEVKCQNRKDVNVLCDWVVTLPKDVEAGDERDFFEYTYDFLEKRYGKENVVSAWVHMDETTPHMHFAFVPVDARQRVCAKEVVNRQDLRTFHQDLSSYIDKYFGYEVAILNDATKEGNKSIAELKRTSAIDMLQEAQKASKIVLEAQKQVNVLLSEKKALTVEIDALNDKLESIKAGLSVYRDADKSVQYRKTAFGDNRVISSQDFDALCKTAAVAEQLIKDIEPARKLLKQKSDILNNAERTAQETISSADDYLERAKSQARGIIQDAKKEAKSIEEDRRSARLELQIEHMERVINSNSRLSDDYQRAEKALHARQRQLEMEREDAWER